MHRTHPLLLLSALTLTVLPACTDHLGPTAPAAPEEPAFDNLLQFIQSGAPALVRDPLR